VENDVVQNNVHGFVFCNFFDLRCVFEKLNRCVCFESFFLSYQRLVFIFSKMITMTKIGNKMACFFVSIKFSDNKKHFLLIKIYIFVFDVLVGILYIYNFYVSCILKSIGNNIVCIKIILLSFLIDILFVLNIQ